MKNEYIIVKHVDEQEAKERGCAATLYYCGAGWHFSAMRHNAEVFTNKRKAAEKMKWADKYGAGSDIKGRLEIESKKEVSARMRFSLINVYQQRGNVVDGNWIQDFTGTLEEAIQEARDTERVNGGRITVAVVEGLAGSIPAGDFRVGLKRLDA